MPLALLLCKLFWGVSVQAREAELLAQEAHAAAAAREEYGARVAAVAAEEQRPQEHHRRKVLWSL